MNERCFECKKSSHVLIKCKCLKSFCTRHLLPEIHKCSEMKKHSEESFNKNKDKLMNEKIIAKKIDVI
jgi:hypothetical protein